MIAAVTGLEPGEFVHTLGDAHLYLNHLEQARQQLARAPRPLPRLDPLPAKSSIFDFSFADIVLSGYDPHPHIPAAVSSVLWRVKQYTMPAECAWRSLMKRSNC